MRKVPEEAYYGEVLFGRDVEISPYRFQLIADRDDIDVTIGDLMIVERTDSEKSGVEVPKFLVEIESARINGLFDRRYAVIVRRMINAPRIPAQESAVTTFDARVLKVKKGNKILEPGLLPTTRMRWRKLFREEISEFLRLDFEGVPMVLAKSTCEVQRDIEGNLIVMPHAYVLPYFIELIAGAPGSGKTTMIGLLAWDYTQNFRDPETGEPAAFICVNNKSIDLLYLDEVADYDDPLWKELNIEPEGIKDFQIVYPSTDGCSRDGGAKTSGCGSYPSRLKH